MKIVALADTHVDSRVGLSLDTTSGRGAETRAALLDFWRAACAGPWGAPDVLIHGGDIIEGQDRKQAGLGSVTSNLLEQCDHAADLLRMWRAKRIFITKGSGYHVEADHSGFQCEEYIARKLVAEECPGQEHLPVDSRDRASWHWYLTLAGVTFHVSHHIGVSSVFHYKSTPTAREMLYAKLNDMLRHETEQYRTNVVLRAHAHYYNALEFSGSLGIVLPCWKGLDDFAQKKGAIAYSPDIGFVGFEVENGVIVNREYWKIRLDQIQKAPHVVVQE